MSRAGWMAALSLFAAGAVRADDDFEPPQDQALITVRTRSATAVARAMDWNLFFLDRDHARVHLGLFLPGIGAVDLDGSVAGGTFTGVVTVGRTARLLEMPLALARTGSQVTARGSFELDLGEAGRAQVELAARLYASEDAVFSGGAWRGP